MYSDDPFFVQLAHGIALFNGRQFYECHDVLEDLWLQESTDRQPLLQAIIQAAVAFHHFEHGRFGAARSMLLAAMDKLRNCPALSFGVEAFHFRLQLAEWKSQLDHRILEPREGPVTLPFPEIRYHDQQKEPE